MPGFPNLSSVGVYLTQWLKTASKDKIIFEYSVSGLTQSLFRFKCLTCGQNWNVGQHLFSGTSVPSELQDWVKEHRHVCKKYINSCSGIQCDCTICKWPYGAHEESWQPQQAINSQIEPAQVQKEPGPKIPRTLPEHKGRKFRD